MFDRFCGTGMTGVATQTCGECKVVMSLGYQVKPDGTILQEETDQSDCRLMKVRKAVTQQNSEVFKELSKLTKITNGSRAGSGLRLKEGKASTAIEWTYAMLRDGIIKGVYPQGSKCHLDTLKTSLGVSGSTLREALTRLIGDGLVSAEGQKGFTVTAMTLADLDDLTNARIMLETTALIESIEKGKGDWEDNLVLCFRRLTRTEERINIDPAGSFDEWEMRNQEFHKALVAASTSKWLASFRDVLFHNSERYRRLSGTQGPPPAEVHAEHKEIFEAAMSRDTERAVSALAGHIGRSANIIRSNKLLNDPER